MKAVTSMVAGLVIGLSSMSVSAQEAPDAQQTYADIEKTLGSVPTFLRAFSEAGLPGAWQEMKSVQMSPDTALPPKVKELIGLAVAAQVPCEYCIYFHTAAAKANGASDEEIREAIAMAALTRHWSTVLNGSQTDFATFRKEVDQIMSHGADQARAMKDK